jgi:hypothetical protein
MRRRHVLQILPLAIAGLHLAPVRGQAPGTFPEPGKPIRLVVPFPAGGTSDLRARQVAEHLRQDAGWTVVVDNRPGASGMIGSDLVAKAPADGYTLLLGTIGTLAINPAVFPAQPYNVLHDFQPVTQFSRSVSVLMAHRNSGITSLAQLEPPRAPANRWPTRPPVPAPSGTWSGRYTRSGPILSSPMCRTKAQRPPCRTLSPAMCRCWSKPRRPSGSTSRPARRCRWR